VWTTVPESGPLQSYVLIRPHDHPGDDPGLRTRGAAAHADEELWAWPALTDQSARPGPPVRSSSRTTVTFWAISTPPTAIVPAPYPRRCPLRP
jgi:hypothetical protein